GSGRRRRRQRRHGVLLRAAAEERPQPAPLEQPPTAPDRDHHLDRTHLPPPTTPDPPRPLDPHRVRDNDEQTPGPRGL
ncbi:MAG: Transposase, partial [uncultured Propionibacteriaceae bacterium]